MARVFAAYTFEVQLIQRPIQLIDKVTRAPGCGTARCFYNMNAIHAAQQAMAPVSNQPIWVIALYAAFICLTLILIVRLVWRK